MVGHRFHSCVTFIKIFFLCFPQQSDCLMESSIRYLFLLSCMLISIYNIWTLLLLPLLVFLYFSCKVR